MGMATRMKVVVFVLLLVGGVFCLHGESLGQTEEKQVFTDNPFLATVDSIAQGKELFIVGCVACHGEQGRGDGPASIFLERSPRDLTDTDAMNAFTDLELFEMIGDGNDIMPAFEDAYTQEEIWHIVHYVRTLSQNK